MGVLCTCDRVFWVFYVHMTGFYVCFKYMSQGFMRVLSTRDRILWVFLNICQRVLWVF
jgi:hypothetical protein